MFEPTKNCTFWEPFQPLKVKEYATKRVAKISALTPIPRLSQRRYSFLELFSVQMRLIRYHATSLEALVIPSRPTPLILFITKKTPLGELICSAISAYILTYWTASQAETAAPAKYAWLYLFALAQ